MSGPKLLGLKPWKNVSFRDIKLVDPNFLGKYIYSVQNLGQHAFCVLLGQPTSNLGHRMRIPFGATLLGSNCGKPFRFGVSFGLLMPWTPRVRFWIASGLILGRIGIDTILILIGFWMIGGRPSQIRTLADSKEGGYGRGIVGGLVSLVASLFKWAVGGRRSPPGFPQRFSQGPPRDFPFGTPRESPRGSATGPPSGPPSKSSVFPPGTPLVVCPEVPQRFPQGFSLECPQWLGGVPPYGPARPPRFCKPLIACLLHYQRPTT